MKVFYRLFWSVHFWHDTLSSHPLELELKNPKFIKKFAVLGDKKALMQIFIMYSVTFLLNRQFFVLSVSLCFDHLMCFDQPLWGITPDFSLKLIFQLPFWSLFLIYLWFSVWISSQFFTHRFHNTSNSKFTSTIRNEIFEAHDSSDRGQRDDMAVVVLDHFRQKSLEHPKVGECIDFEYFFDFSDAMFKNLMLRHDTRIVDQDSDNTDLTENFAADFQHCLSIRHIDTELKFDKLFWSFLTPWITLTYV